MMRFTFEGYENIINCLRKNNYVISNYHKWKQNEKCAILRHDIDYDPFKAMEFARFEHNLGVSSTYFVLLTSDFYNVFSKSVNHAIKSIIDAGHEIGLHFDEVRYPDVTIEGLKKRILIEASILEQAIDYPITTVSMHRPSRSMLEADLKITNIINSYGKVFFNGFKYLSDSRRQWREPIMEIIESGEYDHLHILTHAFWYEKEESDIYDSVYRFVNNANLERYNSLADNITDLQRIMSVRDIAGSLE